MGRRGISRFVDLRRPQGTEFALKKNVCPSLWRIGVRVGRATAIGLPIAGVLLVLLDIGGLSSPFRAARSGLRPFLSPALPAAGHAQGPAFPHALLDGPRAQPAQRAETIPTNTAEGPAPPAQTTTAADTPPPGPVPAVAPVRGQSHAESHEDAGDYSANYGVIEPDAAPPAISTPTAIAETPAIASELVKQPPIGGPPAEIVAATAGAEAQASADLSLAIAGLPPPPLATSPIPVLPGTPIAVSLILSNSGPDTATGILIGAPVIDSVVILPPNLVSEGRILGGTWILDQLAPGASATRDLQLLAAGSDGGTITFEVAVVNEADPDSVPGAHDVPEDDWITLALTMETGGPVCAFEETGIAGALYEDIDGDGQFDPDDEPGIPALRVQLIQVDALGPGQDAILRETVSDAQGFYDFFGVAPQGLYRVAVDDFVLGPDVVVSTPDALDAPIEITAEDCFPNRNVGYLLLHAIEGQVWVDTNVNGQPDEDTAIPFAVQVQLSQRGQGGEFNPIETNQPDAETGRFAFENLRPGTYRVELVEEFIFTTDASYDFTCQGSITANVPPPVAQFGVVVVTPIELASFAAVDTGAGVLVTWRTAVELENLGFYLYRGAQPNGPRTRVTPDLLLGRGTSLGGEYRFLDEGGNHGDWYWLEDIDWSIRSTLHGPARAAP